VSTLAAASLAILLFAAACLLFALWAGQLPWLNVVTGAKPTGPASMPPPEPEPYNPLPAVDNPKAGGARIARHVSQIPHQTNRGRSL
jgi:hypothetical protein